jgi:hypothetical protein
MPAWPSAPVRQRPRPVAYPRENGVELGRELMLEDARSTSKGLWRNTPRMRSKHWTPESRLRTWDGRAEIVDAREALERVQGLSLEVSEELDAYQRRYAR